MIKERWMVGRIILLAGAGWLLWIGLIPVLAPVFKPVPPLYQDQFIAFGTLIDVSLAGIPPEQATALGREIQRYFNEKHQQWHAWHVSDLTRFNQQLATLQPVPIPASLEDLLVTAYPFYQHSQGLFNPAIGKLIQLWGFQQEDWPQQPPSPAAIEALKPFPQLTQLQLDLAQHQAQSSHPGLQLDFGAFAKGYALDQVMQYLQHQGVHHALINAGGNLKAMGQKNGQPWRIGIRHPREATIMAALTLQGEESVMTSGDYERYFTVGAQRYHHIIDPRTGYPATGAIAATVIHANAALADAASTALLIAGPDDWSALAKKLQVMDVLLVDTQLQVYLTQSMLKRIEFLMPFTTIVKDLPQD